MPTPADEPIRSEIDRHVQFAWLLQTIGDDIEEVTLLDVYHDREHRQFSAFLSREKQAPGRRSLEVGRSLRLSSDPVGRFNIRALHRHAEASLRELRAMNGDERVAELFTPTDRSCGCRQMSHESCCAVYAASLGTRFTVGKANV